MNEKEFLEEFNSTKPINEQEESVLIDVLNELLKSLTRKRQRGGYNIQMEMITDKKGNTIGFKRDLNISLLELL